MPLRAFWPLLRLSRPHARPTALNEFDTSPLKSLPDCVDMAWLAHARLEIGDDGHRQDRMSRKLGLGHVDQRLSCAALIERGSCCGLVGFREPIGISHRPMTPTD